MHEPFEVEKQLLVAQQLPDRNGYTWTLASRLGDMLRRVEGLYGPRDLTFTFVGVELSPDGIPRLWYPGNCRHVVIQLTLEAATNSAQAYYQLAHECVHLLSPAGAARVNVLEEGLATHFAEYYTAEVLRQPVGTNVESYRDARTKLCSLLAYDQSVIRALREREPALHLVTAGDILHVCNKVPLALAQELVAPFQRE